MLALLTVAGCTSSKSVPTQPPDSTITRTVTGTRQVTPSPTYTPPKPSYAPNATGLKAPKGEIAKFCPYVSTGLEQQPNLTGPGTMYKLEGDRVGLTTVLPQYKPVGCRFYFWTAEGNPVADILPTTFASALDAHNAMVQTSEQGKSATGVPNFVPGVDGVQFQTTFAKNSHGDNQWAFAFAKGKIMVVVHTWQWNSPPNAEYIAQAIVGKF